MSAIDLTDVSLSFGDTRAVDRVTADVPSGRFLALLGPSGCGKTTLLRLIAGLARPDSGRIVMGGRVVASDRVFVGPEDRRLGMVFQSYALWPHMTVAGNVGFGLSHLPRPEREARIAAALGTVGMAAMAARKPHALSGGQRQRVALARSLATRPQVLLLDEPLANLDAHLRLAMLAEFRRIHAEIGCTIVFVTHDQNEAMAVADLVGVMDRGRLQQIDTPQQLFLRPASPMVARFVGQGRTLPVTVEDRSGGAGGTGDAGRCRVRVAGALLDLAGTAAPGPAWLCLHPRDLEPDPHGLPVTVSATRFEDGYHVAELLFDDIDHEDPVPLRLNRPAAAGERLRVAIRGGWVLPRDGRDLALPPRPTPALTRA